MKLHRPISIMTVGGADHPKTYWIDCPIDVWPSQECRRIEIPRELCRYIMSLEREIDEVAEQAAEIKRLKVIEEAAQAVVDDRSLPDEDGTICIDVKFIEALAKALEDS
jgi:hypothetical protein